MSSTPVFDTTFSGFKFTNLPTEFVDRYTPEMARKEGYLAGLEAMRAEVLSMARAVEKPTRQLQDFAARIEAIEYE